ncbi:MAG TPA: amidohydrolase family protein, partial [Clostridiaceae bacterium]|nr:amidohydrolase family protein [Clostridiaceae bacterium]
MSLLLKNCTLRHRDGLWDVYCQGKTIEKIGQALDLPAETVIDAGGKLLVPALIDPHIHLDKVNILDSVRKNVSGTLTEAIEIIWDRKKQYTDEDVIERAGAVLDQALKNGTLAMRTHVDIDTIGGLKPLSGVLALREKYKDRMTLQLVAFPQEGILKDPGCDKLMDEAMAMGCDIVGGMPANEATPEDSLAHVKYCFDLAEKYDADVDMHVDETDDPFYRTLEMVADETI